MTIALTLTIINILALRKEIFSINPGNFLFLGTFAYLGISPLLSETFVFSGFHSSEFYLFERTNSLISHTLILMNLALSLAIVICPRAQKTDSTNIETLTKAQVQTLSVLGTICVIFCIIYLSMLDKIPLFVALTDPTSYALSRELATTKFPNYGYFANFFYYYLPIVWTLLLLGNHTKKAAALAAFDIFINLATGQKAPLIYKMILAISAISFKKRFNSSKKVFILASLAGSGLFCLAMVQNFGFRIYQYAHFEAIASALKRRAFDAAPNIFQWYVKVFETPIYSMELARSTKSVDQIIWSIANPQLAELGHQGTLNTMFVANMYASIPDTFSLNLAIFLVFFFLFIADRLFWSRINSIFSQYIFCAMTLAYVYLVLTDAKTALTPLVYTSISTWGILMCVSPKKYFHLRPPTFQELPVILTRLGAIIFTLYFLYTQIKRTILLL